MNEISQAAAIVLAVLALLGVCGGIVAWFYRRGGQERAFTEALTENTTANKELTSELRDFKAETFQHLRDHDWRLKIIEAKLENK